ncbi:hypothetical protein [Thiomonas sp. 13-64-67]|jgi:hypothetical protein|uniref:hypothetical protein n=1 Tax=Thiomonas sp. 13-64-67 TaxID=1970447 RepID=UPI00257B1D99|nr:hypothetical protein [Thiomonas sp. 13-64-67]
MILLVLFWAAALFILYTYVGYPVLIGLLARLSFSEGDCTKYQESAALPELAACKAA